MKSIETSAWLVSAVIAATTEKHRERRVEKERHRREEEYLEYVEYLDWVDATKH